MKNKLIILLALLSNYCFAEDNITILPQKDLTFKGCTWFIDRLISWDFLFSDIECYFLYLIEVLLRLSVLVAGLYVFYGGFKYLTSFWGKADWKKTIINAVYGLGLALMSWVILDVIMRLLTE